MNGIIYGAPGSGKTVNSTLVEAPKRNKNLLINLDNSAVVLNNFKRENLDIVSKEKASDVVSSYIEACDSKKYDNIIVDNLTELIQRWIDELEFDAVYKDVRKAYQYIYVQIRTLTRKSAYAETNSLFTAWEKQEVFHLPDGTQITRIMPDIREKIFNSICGLMNVVAWVTKKELDGKDKYFYVTEGGNKRIIAKDQIGCRASCTPEKIFTIN